MFFLSHLPNLLFLPFLCNNSKQRAPFFLVTKIADDTILVTKIAFGTVLVTKKAIETILVTKIVIGTIPVTKIANSKILVVKIRSSLQRIYQGSPRVGHSEGARMWGALFYVFWFPFEGPKWPGVQKANLGVIK